MNPIERIEQRLLCNYISTAATVAGGAGAGTVGAAAGPIADAAILAHAMVGSGRGTANYFVQNFQNPRGQAIINAIDAYNKNPNPTALDDITNQWQQLYTIGNQFSNFGNGAFTNNKTVWDQAQKSLQWIPDFLSSQGVQNPSQILGTPSGPSSSPSTGGNPMDFGSFMNSLNLPTPSSPGNGFNFTSNNPWDENVPGSSGGGGSNSVLSSIISGILGGITGRGAGGLNPTIPSLPGRNPTQGQGNNNSTSNTNWPAILTILAGLSGGLAGRGGTTTVTPTFDSAISPLRQQSIDAYSKLLTTDPDMSGYYAGQASNINNLATKQAQNTEEILASHGITGPAVGTALSGVEANRVASLSNVKQQLPLLSRQLQLEALNPASSFVNASRGTTSTGPTNILGGASTNIAALLAALYGTGAIH